MAIALLVILVFQSVRLFRVAFYEENGIQYTQGSLLFSLNQTYPVLMRDVSLILSMLHFALVDTRHNFSTNALARTSHHLAKCGLAIWLLRAQMVGLAIRVECPN